MRRLSISMLTIAAVALLATEASAQGRRGGFGRGMQGNKFMLLSQESVQEELKLTDQQQEKVGDLRDKMMEAFQDIRGGGLSREEIGEKFQEMNTENEKAIAGFLKPDQLKRLNQISLQQAGLAGSLDNKEVADALKLSADQKDKITDIRQDMREQSQELFQEARESGDFGAVREAMQEMQKKTTESIIGVLTDDQKAAWKELSGPEFKGEIRNPFGGGRRGRGGR